MQHLNRTIRHFAFIFILLTSTSSAISSGFQASFSITGKWFAQEIDNSVIEIVETEKGLVGTIIQSDEPDYVGKKVIYDVSYNKENNEYQGTIYSVVRKMTLNGTFSRKDDTLKVVGSKFIISKTFFWERYE